MLRRPRAKVVHAVRFTCAVEPTDGVHTETLTVLYINPASLHYFYYFLETIANKI